ncbi:MAG: GntR family transcriptional regulator, partial [Bacteroidia bacterium]|nr:GntR family transcriptional regulator [Bacteroidia bacterium]
MIEVGRFHDLNILRDTSVGLYLGDETGEEDVLLPNKYCPEKFEIGDQIEVFVYRDNDERKIATTLEPYVLMNEFSLLKVNDVSEVGAFLDWGLEKDLLVPFKEQKQKMEVDRWYMVYLDIDEQTDRLYGSAKVEKRLQNKDLTIEEGDEVEIVVYQKTELGFTVIVNNLHRGLVYKNEVFEELEIGDKLDAYVKKIREENKLDISLQAIGYKNYNDPNCELIYEALQKNNGTLT